MNYIIFLKAELYPVTPVVSIAETLYTLICYFDRISILQSLSNLFTCFFYRYGLKFLNGVVFILFELVSLGTCLVV